MEATSPTGLHFLGCAFFLVGLSALGVALRWEHLALLVCKLMILALCEWCAAAVEKPRSGNSAESNLSTVSGRCRL
ncbi:hypothetical protein CDAR_585781 [Caerostris darwini]|uniref:Uncharacterized protein n=1 Tax=Caerostris darwini TaxID=1538125 RepID=A0AAV4TMS0_9ARAC|nr:hypothetical protein CDAR_585781 [Caerostris darwini]